MPRLKSAKRLQVEFFWRAHLKGWRDSDLNQREYCGLHGLPLKRFGNWRATFKDEERVVPEGLLWRRGGGHQALFVLAPRRHLALRRAMLSERHTVAALGNVKVTSNMGEVQ
jgi:hypothetical protein